MITSIVTKKHALMVCLIVLGAILFIPKQCEAGMVPRSVLERVFSLKLGNETATGFAIEVDGKQYVVTARHLLAGSPSLSNIEIFHDNKWSAVPFKIISVEPPQVDIAVPNSICLGNKRLLIK